MQHLIIGILLASLLLFCGYKLLRPFILEYLRQYRYRKILQRIAVLYQPHNPYLIAQAAKTKHADENLTYGEIELCAFLDLLAQVNPTQQDILYDLGSGAGKTVIAAKLRYPALTVKGIERLEPLCRLAQVVTPPDITNVYYINHDFLEINFSDATLIFINATGFSHALWEPLMAKLVQLKPTTKIILTSKTLPETAFIQHYAGMEKMNWGLCSTYIYEKK
ncbi:hypothetical protein [Candidatus Berkiella aquae]|uniref:Histone-lysine N-methyltransferase, H3 lysine-79 specific n=1 Tax=Candidatus Berkiella aquae TaxID=295108 RepID=A0A0Q9YW14_9GAMM|nr:hypothetical protein [Candidatus Berkiella aquae]MCS5711364.1 hypothetical protein [Candidatus Berkiella aquae]